MYIYIYIYIYICIHTHTYTHIHTHTNIHTYVYILITDDGVNDVLWCTQYVRMDECMCLCIKLAVGYTITKINDISYHELGACLRHLAYVSCCFTLSLPLIEFMLR